MSELPGDDRQHPGIKRPYFVLPEEIPDDFRCIKIQIPDGDEYLEQLRSVLKMLTMWYNFARDETRRGKLIADLWRDALLLPELGCLMNCEDLTACLQPLFDALTSQLESMQEQVQQLVDQATANKAKLPETITAATDPRIYAGALALVREMNKVNVKIYNDAEMSFVDNAAEALAIVLELFPRFAGFSYDEGFDLGQAFFENQVTAYNAAYTDMEEPAACDLMCRIIANDKELTIDVWGDWLNELELTIPGNAAAKVFAKYAPARQTFLNQVAAFFNQEISLEQFFKDLWQVYFSGTQSPVPVPPTCDCVTATWIYTLDSATLPAWVTFPSPGWGAIAGKILTQTQDVLLGQDVRGIWLEVEFPDVTTITAVKIRQEEGAAIVGPSVVNRFTSRLDALGGNQHDVDLPIQDGPWTVDDVFETEDTKKLVIQYLFVSTTLTLKWPEITIEGTGTNPFEAP